MLGGGRASVILAVLALAAACRATAPTTIPSSGVRELTASPAPLPPGTYTRAAFQPSVTLVLDEGWTSVNLFDDFFDVEQDVGSPDVIAVQVARPRGFIGRSGVQAVHTPAEVYQVLSENPGLTVGALEGRAFDIENRSGQHVGVLAVEPGTLGIDSGRKLRIACYATPQGLVAVMVGGSVAKWKEATAAAEPILASIRFPQEIP